MSRDSHPGLVPHVVPGPLFRDSFDLIPSNRYVVSTLREECGFEGEGADVHLERWW